VKYRIVTAIAAIAIGTCLTGALAASTESAPASPFMDRIQALEYANRNDEAFALAKIGAAAGDRDSEFKLSRFYGYGIGTKLNAMKSMIWRRKAAEEGQVTAQIDLAAMYYHGRGMPEDDAKAFYWYDRAAQQGDTEGLFAAGMFYERGDVIAKNHSKAVAMIRQAAHQGSDTAQVYLADVMGIHD
jgi:TPR repeat protein